MKNIKVLQIGKYYPSYIGGTENHLFTLVNELKKEVTVKVLVANTKFKTSVENDNGITVFRLASLGSFFSLPLILSLPFWLKKQKADILHFHLPNPLSIFSYFISRPKGRIIVSYHSDIVRQRIFNPLFNPFLNRFLKKADSIIVTSANLIKNSAVLQKFKNKCSIIPYGIDINRFRPDAEVFKKSGEIKQKYGSPLILFVGRLVYYKGLKYLLGAMKNINASLLVVGDGPLKKRLKNFAKNLGVSDKVIWAGEIKNEEVAPYYHACDIFILPSNVKAESFGIVQLEASACGKAVVSTNLPTGVPFANLDGKTGVIVPPADSCALASAVNHLLASPQLRQAYGQNGKARVEEDFTKEKMADDILKVYGIIRKSQKYV